MNQKKMVWAAAFAQCVDTWGDDEASTAWEWADYVADRFEREYERRMNVYPGIDAMVEGLRWVSMRHVLTGNRDFARRDTVDERMPKS